MQWISRCLELTDLAVAGGQPDEGSQAARLGSTAAKAATTVAAALILANIGPLLD